MGLIFKRLLLGLAGLLFLVVVGVLALSRFDPRFRVTDWRIVINAVTGLGAPDVQAVTVSTGFSLPAGMSINLYATQIPKARMLRLTKTGDLLVSQPRLGQISRVVRDANGDGQADGTEVLISSLDRPNGLDIADGWLYIAEGGAVGRVRFDEATGKVSGSYQRILEGIPAGENHWTRTLRVGPDGWIYLSIGSSCNVCIEKHEWRAAMIRFRPDGSAPELYAGGLRNSVGFDWAPWSGELFATDNGRDLLGDDFPPCELNRITQGGFYGWPHLHGFGTPDPDFGAADPALLARAIVPEHGFGAHVAPLGISFLRSPALTGRFGNAAIAALHGSWNRSTPDGYRLVLLQWQADGKIKESVFLGGFERKGQVIGRPVDVAETPDGQLLVSDDYAGVIYRLAISGKGTAANAQLATGVIAPLPLRTGNPLAGIAVEEIAAARLAAGELMQRHGCATCHVPGSVLAGKWDSLGTRYGVAELSAFFLAPTPPMPIFPLSDSERRQLAIHLLAK